MKITSILSRYRLSIKLLVLSLTLVACVYIASPAAANPVWCEEMGCVEWSQEHGCTATMFCCVFNDGGAMCWRNGQLVD